MSNKLAPVVVPVVVDSTGVDKGIRQAKSKLQAGFSGPAGTGTGSGDGGAGFASVALGAAIGARMGATPSRRFRGNTPKRGFISKSIRRDSMSFNRYLNDMETLNEGFMDPDGFINQGKYDQYRAAERRVDAVNARHEALQNRTGRSVRLRRATDFARRVGGSAFGRLGSNPMSAINSIAASSGIGGAYAAVGPVGLGVGVAAVGSAALGSYSEKVAAGVGNLPMQYKLGSELQRSATNIKNRFDTTTPPEAGFLARMAAINPGLAQNLDMIGTGLGSIFSAEGLGTALAHTPTGVAGNPVYTRYMYGEFWKQRWDSFNNRWNGSSDDLRKIRNETIYQSQIAARNAI